MHATPQGRRPAPAAGVAWAAGPKGPAAREARVQQRVVLCPCAVGVSWHRDAFRRVRLVLRKQGPVALAFALPMWSPTQTELAVAMRQDHFSLRLKAEAVFLAEAYAGTRSSGMIW